MKTSIQGLGGFFSSFFSIVFQIGVGIEWVSGIVEGT